MIKRPYFSDYIRKSASITLSFFFLLPNLNVSIASASSQSSSPPLLAEPTSTDVPTADIQASSYTDYLTSWPNATAPADTIVIAADQYDAASADGVLQMYPDFEGQPGNSVLFDDTHPIAFPVHIETAGLYTMNFLYYTGSASGSAATRSIEIDGELPFSESAEVSFTQLWMDENKEKQYDKENNEIRSKQVQISQWNTQYAEDSSGRITGALQYYFTAGEHTITLIPVNESLLLNRIELTGRRAVPSYEMVKASYASNGYSYVGADITLHVEAEDADALKSDQTLVPLNDRTSPSVTPYDVNLVRYNSIGAGQWQVVGQWLEWAIDVPQSGLYQLGAHFKQNIKTNDVSIRELIIDGVLPFKEAASLHFPFKNSWQTAAFTDESGEPYLFYLEKGSHTLRLRAVLGNASSILQQADETLRFLNEIYREIVVITGTDPDPYANYQFEQAIPDTLENMRGTCERLKKLAEDITAFNGQGGASTAAINRLITQIGIMTEDPDKIASHLQTFRDNISSFGTWINDFQSQPLQLDALYLYSPQAELPAGEANFFKRIWHSILQFLWSFFTDFDAVGLTEVSTDKELTVWIASGRDQSQLLRQMINDDFTPQSNVSVNLQLVTATALLPSIVSGNNPDVYIGSPQADPINLALRDAVLDLRQFPDFDAVVNERFAPATIVPFTMDDHVYALPDAMDYPMLFVRTDILTELGISKDDLQDWETILFKILPILQTNSLTMGVPVSIQSYLTFLYQAGGAMYEADGRSSALASAEAISAMESYAELYTQYGLPLSYDFANRFRSGEMPVALANFTSYNQLSVFAPDIRGQWEMLPVPGTMREDGTLDRSCTATVTGSVIMSSTEQPDACWEFLKWWTSAEVQQEYSLSLESIVGSAARYNTANKQALSNAAWERGMKNSLLSQLEDIRPYVEVPGGYLTSRYYDFSFRYIVYDGDNVRDTMIEAASSINTEIAHKRQEYLLD